MKSVLLILLIPLFLLLNGCIEIVTLIKVHNDGSGEVHETVLVSKEIVMMIREFAESMPGEVQEENKPFNLFDEEELRSQASTFGEGVEYNSGKEIKNESQEGFMAVYSFKDLNSLLINQNPNAKIPFNTVDESDEVEEELVRFSFTKGETSEIQINFIDSGEQYENSLEDTSGIVSDTTYADTTFNEVAKLMKDMKITLAIEPEGTIKETNATHIEGNRITLFNIDFNELLSNEDKLNEFKQNQPQSFDEFKKIVKDIPGIKIELNQPVIIKFQ